MPKDSKVTAISTTRILRLLKEGEMEETHGLMSWSSNHTFLMSITDGEFQSLASSNPRRGERPLWDFPRGTLCQRETAAFVVSEALGWRIVPPTILRDGPYGVGMVQLFVAHDPEQNYFTLGPEHRPQLQRIALFDHIVNNADRKGGHCLLGKDGQIWSIDHGICFHYQPKLRTVIWDFAGQKIPEALLGNMHKLREQVNTPELSRILQELLSYNEIDAFRHRLEALIRSATYPEPGSGRCYPWPPV